MKLWPLLICLFISLPLMAQNLMEERIWKVSSRKKSIFLDSGVFHYNSNTTNSGITGVRSSAVPGRGYERLVIDFTTPSIPKLYGHISAQDKKISVDFFGTSVTTAQPQLKDSKFIKSIDFISVDGKNITMELSLKNKASFDVFYLENPGRLVIDVR
ncbi:MAG TPA: hypothetical protein VNJ08_00155 [Bacteriovoracaceae bacterium]|nr:hypothetical protein [Bacteriovoracaceae bacterium]